MNFNLFYENSLFVIIATSFFAVVGWLWRKTKPYQQFQIQNLTALKPLQQLEFMILNISTDR